MSEAKRLERLTLRLDDELLARLETHARRLEDLAGVRLARSEVARKVLALGFDLVERDLAGTLEAVTATDGRAK